MQRRVFVFTLIGILLSVVYALAQSDERLRAIDHGTEAQRTYAIITQLPLVQRKALFRSLSPTVKAAVWIAHLEDFLRRHPDLDSNQRAIVNAAMATADNQLYEPAGPGQANARELAAQLATAAHLTFSKELLDAAFYDLGDSSRSPTIAFDSSVREGTPMASETDPVVLDDCSCNHNFDYCSSGGCMLSGCQPVPSGCGFIWAFACDGHCQ